MKAFALIFIFTLSLLANEVEIVDVTSSKQKDGTYRFSVTLLHEDSSWTHYADSWSVLDKDKKLIVKRVLWHPHEYEQPFTRSQSGIRIDKTVNVVYIRAHDKIHGYTKSYYKHNLN